MPDTGPHPSGEIGAKYRRRIGRRRSGMWSRVLGSAAGGGFPQWNRSCAACRAMREDSQCCRAGRSPRRGERRLLFDGTC